MPTHRRRAAAAILAAALPLATGLAACGDLPRPFAHNPDRQTAGLSRLVGGTGVAILAQGPEAEAYAVALRALDIPATLADIPREGGYALRPDGKGGWDLSGPGGVALLPLAGGGDIAVNAQRIAQAVEADALRPVTLRSAIVAGAGDTPESAGPLPALRVVPVEGLDPGRGRLLAGAVEEALRRAGLDVSADATWSVAGQFESAPAAPGAPVPVRLTWRLLDPQGAESGVAQQVNAVPAAMLERGFAALAPAIAGGAAEGVAALAAQAGRQQGQDKPGL